MSRMCNSEHSVGRALREYGKRNRALEHVVGTTKKQVSVHARLELYTRLHKSALALVCIQLRCVLDSLRSSEKRKTDARTEVSLLRRDLVVEKCQRSEYVIQPCTYNEPPMSRD